MNNGVKKVVMSPQTVSRRKSAMSRLKDQLTSNTKTTREGQVELSEGDVLRIKKEISVLSGRI